MEQWGVELGFEHRNGVESRASALEPVLPMTDGIARQIPGMSSNTSVILEISNLRLVVELP